MELGFKPTRTEDGEPDGYVVLSAEEQLGHICAGRRPDEWFFWPARRFQRVMSVSMMREITDFIAGLRKPKVQEPKVQEPKVQEPKEPEVLFFVHCPENGISFHKDEAEARSKAEAFKDDAEFHVEANDWTWQDNEDEICWGRVHGKCEFEDRELTPQERHENPLWDFHRTFELKDLKKPDPDPVVGFFKVQRSQPKQLQCCAADESTPRPMWADDAKLLEWSKQFGENSTAQSQILRCGPDFMETMIACQERGVLPQDLRRVDGIVVHLARLWEENQIEPTNPKLDPRSMANIMTKDHGLAEALSRATRFRRDPLKDQRFWESVQSHLIDLGGRS